MTRQLALDLDFIPVIPPLSIRLEPWRYSKAGADAMRSSALPQTEGLSPDSAASTNSTGCSWPSYAWRSSSRVCDSVKLLAT
jgi:hypothetical protein